MCLRCLGRGGSWAWKGQTGSPLSDPDRPFLCFVLSPGKSHAFSGLLWVCFHFHLVSSALTSHGITVPSHLDTQLYVLGLGLSTRQHTEGARFPCPTLATAPLGAAPALLRGLTSSVHLSSCGESQLCLLLVLQGAAVCPACFSLLPLEARTPGHVVSSSSSFCDETRLGGT